MRNYKGSSFYMQKINKINTKINKINIKIKKINKTY